MPSGIPEQLELKNAQKTAIALEIPWFLNPTHKKRRPKTSSHVELVEPGGFEPPSASTPLSVLHA